MIKHLNERILVRRLAAKPLKSILIACAPTIADKEDKSEILIYIYIFKAEMKS